MRERFRHQGEFRSLRGQVRFFRSRLPEVILLFRVGRYVELYDEDAGTVAGLAGLKVRKGRGMRSVAGAPARMLERLRDRLLAAGYDVAVIDEGGPGRYVRERYVREIGRIAVGW
ncbi:MAG: MutS N-terminal domain-containing protein [Desulfobulbaceae bacterium]